MIVTASVTGYVRPVKTCDPVGIEDIAERLKVRPDTVRMWRHRELMPEPRWTVSSRPAWNWPDIEKWARETDRVS